MKDLGSEIQALLAEHADSSLAAPAARAMLASELQALIDSKRVLYIGYANDWMAVYDKDGSVLDQAYSVDLGLVLKRLGYLQTIYLDRDRFREMLVKEGTAKPIDNIEEWLG